MSQIKFYCFYFILVLSINSCVPNSSKLNNNKKDYVQPAEKGYSIIFYHLDNYVLIYNNDVLVVDTRKLVPDTETTVDLLIDFNNLLKNVNRDQIRIEGYNSACDYCRENRWKIVYEIFEDGESVDYVIKETLQHDSPGLKFTETFNFSKLNN